MAGGASLPMLSQSCRNCRDDATVSLCDFHSECDECGQSAQYLYCADHNVAKDADLTCKSYRCTENSEYVYCQDHWDMVIEEARQEGASQAIDNYEAPSPECERCGSPSYWILCSDHYQQDLEAARNDDEETDREAELRYELSLRDNEINDLKDALKAQEGLTRQVQEQLLKGTTSVADKNEVVRVYDEDGQGYNIPRTNFEAAAKEQGWFINPWSKGSKVPRRETIKFPDGYSEFATDIADIAREKLGMVWPDEVEASSTFTNDDKLIVADLLQREQLRRFLVLRETFVSNPAPETIGIIPTAVTDALEAYQDVTNLMKRIGVDTLRNDVMEQMASVMSERVNQQSLSN